MTLGNQLNNEIRFQAGEQQRVTLRISDYKFRLLRYSGAGDFPLETATVTYFELTLGPSTVVKLLS